MKKKTSPELPGLPAPPSLGSHYNTEGFFYRQPKKPFPLSLGDKLTSPDSVSKWLHSNPHIDDLKLAVFYEKQTKMRPSIIRRLLIRVFQLELEETYNRILFGK